MMNTLNSTGGGRRRKTSGKGADKFHPEADQVWWVKENCHYQGDKELDWRHESCTGKMMNANTIMAWLANLFLCWQAKKFVESVPTVVKADAPKDEVEKLRDALVAVGGVCEIV